MFQVVAVSESPHRRMKVTVLDNLNSAINYAEAFSEKTTLEVVDERTALLRATVTDRKIERTVGTTRREVL